MAHHAKLPILPAAPMAPQARGGLPTVAALEELWRSISARPLWAPPTFFKYLRLRRRMHLRLLDPKWARVVAPAGKVNDCSACTELCCIGPRSTVLLRLTDIAQLMDIGRTDLMTHKKPQFSAEALKQNPSLHRQVASEAWATYPVLKQNSFGACQALSSEGLCGLYPFWPMACARFPYALHVETAQVVYAKRCRSFFIHPRQKEAVAAMQVAAVAAYNARIKDAVLLAYAPKRLSELGILAYLNIGPGGRGGEASTGAF